MNKYCAKCGTENIVLAKFCKTCGNQFTLLETTVEAVPNVRLCSGCHVENALTAKFCKSCGTQLQGDIANQIPLVPPPPPPPPPAAMVKICSSCLAENAPAAKFCRSCGEHFQAESTTKSESKVPSPEPSLSAPSPSPMVIDTYAQQADATTRPLHSLPASPSNTTEISPTGHPAKSSFFGTRKAKVIAMAISGILLSCAKRSSTCARANTGRVGPSK